MISLKEFLLAGLRKYDYQGQDAPGLLTCDNLLVSNFGLRGFKEIDSLMQNSFSFKYGDRIVESFGDLYLLRVSQKPISTISKNSGKGDWSVSALTPINVETGLDYDAEFSDYFHFAGFGPAYLALGENAVLFKLGNSNNLYANTSVTIKTGCNFRQRLICGNLASDFWSMGGDEIFNYYSGKGGTGITSSNLSSNYVFWGNIGGGELGAILIPDMAKTGYLHQASQNVEDSYLLTLLQKGQMGFLKMPWDGEILGIKPLRNHVIVYGEDGIAALTPEGVLFGFLHLSNFGIYDRSSFGGSEDLHYFLTKDFRLMSIDNSLALTELDYREFFPITNSSYETIEEISASGMTFVGTGTDNLDYTSSGWDAGTLVELRIFINSNDNTTWGWKYRYKETEEGSYGDWVEVIPDYWEEDITNGVVTWTLYEEAGYEDVWYCSLDQLLYSGSVYFDGVNEGEVNEKTDLLEANIPFEFEYYYDYDNDLLYVYLPNNPPSSYSDITAKGGNGEALPVSFYILRDVNPFNTSSSYYGNYFGEIELLPVTGHVVGDYWNLNFDGEEVLVTHSNPLHITTDFKNKRTYFFHTDYDHSFVMDKGLSKVSQRILAGKDYYDEFLGIKEVPTNDKDECELVTTTMDFKYPGLKTIRWITLHGKIPSGATLEIGVNFRYNNSSNVTSGSYILANPHNAAYIGITAEEFQIKAKISSHLGVRIDDIQVEVEGSDGRFINVS